MHPYNIWAFENEERTFQAGLERVKQSEFPLLKLQKGSIDAFIQSVPRMFDLIYVDACGPLPSRQQGRGPQDDVGRNQLRRRHVDHPQGAHEDGPRARGALSDAALAILRDQHEARGKNPHVFPGRPQRPLSAMAMSMLLKRMGVDATVHGMRSSFRMWAADVAHAPFEVAEQCLAHVTGNAVVQAYQRSSMLERRRPIMTAWADFVTGKDARQRGPAQGGATVIKIAISIEAFEAIARTLPLDSVSYENEANEQGERYVWLEPAVVNRLGAMRGPGESYSDAILRLVLDSPCR